MTTLVKTASLKNGELNRSLLYFYDKKMIKRIHMLTYFIIVFSLLSIGYSSSYFSDTEIITCSLTADDWPSNNPCTKTLGYWKTHDGAWPVDEIIIGKIAYTKVEAIDIMWISGDGDKTYDMFRQLVAAKLNIEIGCESSCIGDTIEDADDWMVIHPLNSSVQAGSEVWQTGELLHFILDQYNNGELHCDSPPHEPINPMPYDEATGIELNPTLSVYVFDPNNDTMNISFYASDDSLIDTVTNAKSNTTISVIWLDLDYGTIYEWYAVAEDYEGAAQSDIWMFITKPKGGGGSGGGGSSPQNNPPTADANGPYYSNISKDILFNGSNSFDSDGSIISYYWDFGDGANSTDVMATYQYQAFGVYNITLTVTDDDEDKDADSTIATVVGIDNHTPTMAYTGDIFIFNASIFYNSNITAWIEYWYTGGNHTNESMTPTGIDYYYEKIIIIPTNSIKSLHYIIYANNTNNSWNGIEHIVTVIDNDAPMITNIIATPDTQVIDEYVNITCNVSDNIEIDIVKVNITGPQNFTQINVIMNISNNYYYNTNYSLIGEYHYFIWAVDTNNNMISSQRYIFWIANE